jgi:hypothetical protein
MIRTLLLLSAAFFSLCHDTIAQQIPVQLHSRAEQILDRWDVMGIDTCTHSANGYCLHNETSDLAIRASQNTKATEHDVQYLLDEFAADNQAQTPTTYGHREREKAILKHFFKRSSQFYAIDVPDFRLVVNPVIDVRIGKESTEGALPYLKNERGIQLSGDIARKLHFYMQFSEIQTNLPSYNSRWITTNQGYPGFALIKNYQGSINKKFRGVDTNVSEAYVTANLIKQIRVQFGHGRNFIGNGYRSMLLSDFAPVYLFLRLDTRVWKLHYTNLFTEMSATQPTQISGLIAKKHIAAHYLDFQATKRWSVGIFETVVFDRSNGFEAGYLNPVIFYRSVEGMIGSPDNALLGASTKLNLWRSVQCYGQLMLDEFNSKDVLGANGKGWWANKAGNQIGIKYFNAFKINHLDLQVERNAVRPYTYAHQDQQRSYTHYGQALAHPLGANFNEILGIVRYQIGSKILLEAKAFSWKRGHDPVGKNYGSEPWKDYTTREKEYGNYIGQGVASRVQLTSIQASYMLAHNLFLDASATLRKENSTDDAFDSNVTFGSIGVRWNSWKRREEL